MDDRSITVEIVVDLVSASMTGAESCVSTVVEHKYAFMVGTRICVRIVAVQKFAFMTSRGSDVERVKALQSAYTIASSTFARSVRKHLKSTVLINLKAVNASRSPLDDAFINMLII